MLNENKYILRLNSLSGSTDSNLKINLNSGWNDFIDFNEDITNLLDGKKEDNINPFNDGEKIKYSPTGIYGNISFQFNFYNGMSIFNNYTYAGFTNSEINNLAERFTSSFYIFQAYDNFDSRIQKLLHTGYFNGFNFNGPISSHNISYTNESLFVYVPMEYIDSISGNTFDLYLRYYFYNAKIGKFLPLYVSGTTILLSPASPSVNLASEKDFYWKLTFNKTTRKYNINAFLLVADQSINAQYTNLINSSVDSIPLQKSTYPNGNAFKNDGTYSNI